MDSLRVLMVDDDPAIARLLGAVLRDVGVRKLTHVSTAEEAVACAQDADVVLLDHQLPDREGVDVLRSLRDRPHRPSVVVITAHGNEALAAEFLRRGADDYLVKDGSLPDLLPKVLERVRRERALTSALRDAEADLVQAERRAAMGEMTVTLHHEINNPLMAASAEVELLLQGADPLTPGQQASLTEVRNALARIRDIIRRTGSLQDARSEAYPGDLRMVSLGGQTVTPPAIAHGAAALHLPDEALARVAALLVRQAGWTVRRCYTLDELRDRAGDAGVSLVLFASTHEHPDGGLPDERDRDFKVVAFVTGGVEARQTRADLVVHVPFDPTALGTDLQALADSLA